jgi:hypothetical protein
LSVQLRLPVAALAAAISATSCGPLADVATTTSATAASVRVVHGSPDAGSLDVRLDSVGGTTLASATAYGRVGSYVSVAAGTHYVEILAAGSSTASLRCTSPSLAAGTKYTVVVAGTAARGYGTTLGVQCQVFAEPSFSTPSGDYALALHHASPAAAAAGYAVLSYGTFAPGTSAYNPPAGTASFTSAFSNATSTGAVATSVATGATSAPGVGFWFAPQTATAPSTVLATIRPSQGVAGASGASGTADAGDLLPSGTLINFSVYVVDGQNGALALAIGAFD